MEGVMQTFENRIRELFIKRSIATEAEPDRRVDAVLREIDTEIDATRVALGALYARIQL